MTNLLLLNPVQPKFGFFGRKKDESTVVEETVLPPPVNTAKDKALLKQDLFEFCATHLNLAKEVISTNVQKHRGDNFCSQQVTAASSILNSMSILLGTDIDLLA